MTTLILFVIAYMFLGVIGAVLMGYATHKSGQDITPDLLSLLLLMAFLGPAAFLISVFCFLPKVLIKGRQ